MTLLDPLANALTAIKNGERAGKEYVIVKPISKLLIKVLEILQREGYIEKFEYEFDKKGGWAKVYLKGRINDIGAIKPRFSTSWDEIEKWQKRYLPAADFGILLISTPNYGLITDREAIEKRTGGILIAYVY